eukprot:COSAG04_NODE_8563_length_957_cov_2.777389_2_plen_105_part_00
MPAREPALIRKTVRAPRREREAVHTHTLTHTLTLTHTHTHTHTHTLHGWRYTNDASAHRRGRDANLSKQDEKRQKILAAPRDLHSDVTSTRCVELPSLACGGTG